MLKSFTSSFTCPNCGSKDVILTKKRPGETMPKASLFPKFLRDLLSMLRGLSDARRPLMGAYIVTCKHCGAVMHANFL